MCYPVMRISCVCNHSLHVPQPKAQTVSKLAPVKLMRAAVLWLQRINMVGAGDVFGMLW